MPIQIDPTFWMIALRLLTATTLGGALYSIDMLPPLWRSISLFNPVVYPIRGFRWSLSAGSDVGGVASLGTTAAFFCACLGVVAWLFGTGYRMRA